MHMDKGCVSAVHAVGNNIMHVHDVSTFEAMQFTPLLNDFWNKFPSDIEHDTEPGHQAIREDCVNGVIKGTL